MATQGHRGIYHSMLSLVICRCIGSIHIVKSRSDRMMWQNCYNSKFRCILCQTRFQSLHHKKYIYNNDPFPYFVYIHSMLLCFKELRDHWYFKSKYWISSIYQAGAFRGLLSLIYTFEVPPTRMTRMVELLSPDESYVDKAQGRVELSFCRTRHEETCVLKQSLSTWYP